MKKLIINIALLFVFVLYCNAQSIIEQNGIYLNNNHPFTGLYVEHYTNGVKKVEMTVVNGAKEGTTTFYYPSGQVSEVRSYKANSMHGKWETFDKNAKKTGEAHYTNGLKSGTWQIWDKSGQLRYKMYYKAGKKVGTWEKYNNAGKLIAQKNY
ncbi:toxin-antitoxin system YwqK family antitoxin [Prolixibacteraceae bacterium JC049]|nr:toxin-antitoxin system YwqK family antitoxin [Prolixibacteraceae bacterium JC049]